MEQITVKIVRLVFILFLISTIGCSTTGSASYTDGSLEAHLNQIDGVRVTGSGEHAKVMIRSRKLSKARNGQGWGGKSGSNYRESSSQPPLFILNGQKIGRDFQTIKDMLQHREVKSAKLLSPTLAFSQYRRESYYGVIEIASKNDDLKINNN